MRKEKDSHKGFSISDSIVFKSIDTGGNNAGQAGDGKNYGNITNGSTFTSNPYNKADSGDVHVNGDEVRQKAYWDAEAGKADSKSYDKKASYDMKDSYDKKAGSAQSNGDQKYDHDGSNTAGPVTVTNNATQTNMIHADQSQHVWAGVGGDGGDNATAYGGNVTLTVDDFPHYPVA